MSETAQDFFASGKGNGFPYCTPKVDVEDFDYWITLGGYSKEDTGGPTNNQIALSLANAVKIFWQFKRLKGKVFYEDDFESINIEQTVDLEDSEPIQRVCFTQSWRALAFESDLDVEGQISFYNNVREFARAFEGRMVKMMDGGNFIGYGMDYLKTTFSDDARGPLFAGWGFLRELDNRVFAGSLLKLGQSHEEEVDFDELAWDVKYTEISGIPVVAYVGATFGTQGMLDAENLTVTRSGDNKAKLDEIEFWDF